VASYEFFLAKRYLKAKCRTGFISTTTYISIGGVALGVTALIIVLSLMNGFSTEVRNKLLGMDAHLRVLKFHGEWIEDYEKVAKQIERLPHVVAASPFIYWEGMVASAHSAAGVKIKGIDPTSASKVTDIGQRFLYGALRLGPVQEKNCWGIAIGSTLADRLQVNLGDEVYLLSPKGTTVTSLWGTPKMRRFVVTGIFQVGLYDFDASLVCISLRSAQLLLGSGDEVTGIEAKLDDLYKVGTATKQINRALGYPYYTLTWAQMYRHLFNWMKLEKWGSFIVLSLIILVAAFSIISTLVMMVMEKTREIGILKAMGATSKSIRKIFMLQGLVTGVLGTASGCVVGYLLCWIQENFKVISLPADIYIISAVPVNMRPLDFICISAGSLAICFLASLYPANKASSLQPVEAIRYE